MFVDKSVNKFDRPYLDPRNTFTQKVQVGFQGCLEHQRQLFQCFYLPFFFYKTSRLFFKASILVFKTNPESYIFLVKNIQSKHLKFQYFLQFWFIFFVLCLYCVNSMTDCLKQFTINPFSYNSCRFSANFGLSDMICTFFLHFTCLRSNFTFWDDKYVFCIYEPDSI